MRASDASNHLVFSTGGNCAGLDMVALALARNATDPYPHKERPEHKSDGIVALIMALARALVPGVDGSRTVFA